MATGKKPEEEETPDQVDAPHGYDQNTGMFRP